MSPILQISDLKFGWPGSSKPLLDIDSFTVNKGEKVFLRGPSGSGKSTLLNLFGGVLSPQSGQVKVLDTELSSLSGEARDRFRGDHMGFIFQMFNLLPYFSALENVILPCRFSKYRSKRIGDSGGSLENEAERLLQALKLDSQHLRGKRVNELSVGQQQRVATARALIGRPEIIIADEPTSALDSDIRDSFIQLLFAECEKAETTLIFVSHDQQLGEKFDRTVSLTEINKADPSDQMERGIDL